MSIFLALFLSENNSESFYQNSSSLSSFLLISYFPFLFHLLFPFIILVKKIKINDKWKKEKEKRSK